MSNVPSHRRRLEPLLARVGLLAMAIGVMAALLALDVATAPAPSVDHGAAAETWSLHLVAHDGRELGGFAGGMELSLSPLLHYENRPAPGGGDRYRINSMGLRGPELAELPAAELGRQRDRGADASRARPTVAIVGGSAVFGMFVPEELTFCRLLADRFPELEVINGGVVGYLSGQETALVVLKLLDLQPELVIACDGWNDCYDGVMWHQATGREHAVPGVNSSFQIMENRLADYRRLETSPWSGASAWAGMCLRRSRALGWLAREDASRSPPADYPAEFLERAADTYVDNLARMHRLVAAQGGRLIVALQGDARQLPGEPPDHPLTKRLDPDDYTQFRQRARQGLEKRGVEVTDISRRLADHRHESQALFLDAVHLTPAGHTQVANLLESYLEDVRRAVR